MEAMGRALVGLSAYLQLKKAAMHEYHLWNLKKIKQLIFYMFVLYRPTQKKKYLTPEILVFSLITP